MMKLMTMKQYMNMSKPALIRKITKTLKVMPKVKLARLCYNITKSKLPRLRRTKPRALREYTGEFTRSIPSGQLVQMTRRIPKRKTKRKFSRKQLAAQRLFAKRARAGTLKRRKR